MEERDKPVKGGEPQPPTLMVASEVLCLKQMPQIAWGGETSSFQAEQAGQGHSRATEICLLRQVGFPPLVVCEPHVPPWAVTQPSSALVWSLGQQKHPEYTCTSTSCHASLEVSRPPATHLAPVTTKVMTSPVPKFPLKSH